MHNAHRTMKTALFAALALFAADIHAQATETGGAAGFAAGAGRCLDAAWASNNHVKASAYYADYDNDTLENWAEEALGTSPWTNDVAGVSVATAKAIGAFDLVPGAWKAAHGLSSPLSWSEDPDNDGWDNWSEWMSGTDPNAATIRPNPRLAVTLDYQAALRGRLVVWCHSRQDMLGWPDAVYVRDVAIDAPPATVELTDADLIHGHLRQGPCWFFAWMDRDGPTSAGLPAWSDGCPAAIADGQLDGIEIGFGRNGAVFRLTDRAESFARVSWADEAAKNPGDGMFVEVFYSGNRVFRRTIKWPRTWLHEGDIISWNNENSGLSGSARKNFGLGALGDVSASDTTRRIFTVDLTPQSMNEMYEFGYMANYCEISNWMHTASALATPELYGPIGSATVTDARPEFRFRLDPEYTEFRFRLVTRADESGQWVDANQVTVFDRRILAPGRCWNGATGQRDLVVLRSPLSVGDAEVVDNGSTLATRTMFDYGKVYQWAVNAYSPAITVGTSTKIGYFRTPSKSAAGWNIPYSVSPVSGHTAVNVTNHILVCAYLSPACSGVPAKARRHNFAAGVTNYLAGLTGPGPWFIKAWSRDAAGFFSHGRRPVPVYAVPAGSAMQGNAIVIRDCN